jgi:hypothetical protein
VATRPKSNPPSGLPLFVGESRRVGEQPASLDAALEDAYEKARKERKKKDGQWDCFRVVEIQLCGWNPISDYKVHVTPL